MSSDPGTPTLDQLKVFQIVVGAGSFAAAARRLNRATSVVSYTIANLESQLGVPLFDRSAKSPKLTAAGLTVLADARAVSNSIDELRAKVKGLLQGLEAELHLVLDVMLPTERVADALTAFSAQFPTVTLRLHIEALGGVMQLVLDRVATVGICGPLPGIADSAGIERMFVGEVKLIPVASPDHPLAIAKTNKPGATREHVQLVLSDRSQLTKATDFAVVSPRTWRLADLGSKHMLLKAGIGWGNMPMPMVQEDLDRGRLVQLDLPDARGGSYRLDAIYRTDTPPGPAAMWLIERFRDQAARNVPIEEPGPIPQKDKITIESGPHQSAATIVREART
jgi:DNA-binding transcriptional LysR family regulator